LPLQLPQAPTQVGAHALAAQSVDPWAFVQLAPQAPQLPVLLVRFTSQPVEAKVSQLPKPGVQAMPHEPDVQDGVPFVPLQAVGHPPQCAASVFRFASQPLLPIASQFPKPALHAGTHTLAVHAFVPFTVAHTVPQAPQFAALFVVFVSQPFVATRSQLPKPPEQVPSVQAPDGHVSVAFARSHTVLQSLQSASVAMLRSQPLFALPSQLLKFAEHVGVQAPAVQTVEPFAFVQAVAHVPQCVASVARFTSQPSPGSALQLPNPPVHASEHEPRLQVAVAFAPLHAAPQAPQLERLVSVFVSQPLFALPSQLLKPVLHTGVQTPATQLVVPFKAWQIVPHAPQLVASAEVGVSQPFFGLPSQLAKPGSQVGTHTPVVQVVVPCAFVQACPQAPQLVTLVFRFASHPFGRFESQFPKPALQVGTQPPVVHTLVPFAARHAVPQAPQLAVAVFRFTSQPVDARPSQFPKPALQATAQDPSAQLAVPLVPLHTVGHVPQCATDVSVFVSQPFEETASQLPNPALQAPSVQTLLVQVSLAFARLQTAPQAPQLARLEVRFVSQPSPESPLQSPSPAVQLAMPHTAPTQFAVPPPAGQTLPHVLQLLTSVFVLVSQPLFGLPSQLLKPAAQAGTHTPAVQAVVPFAFEQATPQAPQLAVVFSAVSQPFFALASQFPKPALHTGTQAPAAHDVVPFAFVHASPHPLQ
jgi:hypothetical protein